VAEDGWKWPRQLLEWSWQQHKQNRTEQHNSWGIDAELMTRGCKGEEVTLEGG